MGGAVASIAGSIVSSVVSNAIGGSQKPDKPKAQAVAPTANKRAEERQASRNMQRQYAGSGRAGTVLSNSLG